jgi:hypothetical protein
MNRDELITAFHRMVATVSSSNDLSKCWHEVLEINGERGNVTLASADIQSDLESIVAQIKKTLDAQPPSSQIHVMWFGLFDGLRGDTEYAGYYLAGWTDEQQLNEGGTPPYFPESRYLTSQLLDIVKGEAIRVGGESPKFTVFDYAVMFGCAATLSRFAALSLGFGVPVYVGFDSGDFARIAN